MKRLLISTALALAACAPQPARVTEVIEPPPDAQTEVVAPTGLPAPTSAPTDSAPSATAAPPTAEPVTVDLTRLPIGDGNYSTTSPAVGSVWTCAPPNPNAGGASVEGPWIRADGTYDSTAKAVVDGEVTWSHQLAISLQGETRTIAANLLPNHATGNYPISPADDAYNYDRNPNRIAAQTLDVQLPANPTLAAQPSCLPGGAIGIMLTGVVFFNALDAPGRDAAAHETLDRCQGHPEMTGEYHYHTLSTCIEQFGEQSLHSPLVGYAFDGFGIYGHHGQNGRTVTNADLDECHGHTHAVDWDGNTVELYHYHATWEYPYTLGCYRGASQYQSTSAGAGQGGGEPNLAAAAAQLGVTEQQLRDALGPPPPDLTAAAARLGVSEAALRAALGVP